MSIQWSNNLTSKLREMQSQASKPGVLMAALAKEMDVTFRQHFRMLDGRGNKNGWPSNHFWTREVMRQQTFKSDDRSATLEIASPAFLHKITGGIIRPKKGTGLAIPVHPLAYKLGGPKASGLKLQFGFSPRGKVAGYLFLHGQKKYKGKMLRGDMMYVVVRYVNQSAMPDALPNQADLENRLTSRIQSWLQTLAKL